MPGPEAFPFRSSLFSAAFSPDGNRLVASYGDTVIVWDAGERQTLPTPLPEEIEQATLTWHRDQAEAAVRGENWFGVAFHERRALALDSSPTPSWYRLAVANLALGDAADHHQTCVRMLQKFASSTDQSTNLQTAYVCVIDPQAGGDPAALVKVAARPASVNPVTRRVHAAALYRAGDTAGALKEFDAAEANFPRRAWDWLFLAMVHHRLGNAALCRQCYEKALEHQRTPKPFFDWRERYEVKTLQAEVEQILGLFTKP